MNHLILKKETVFFPWAFFSGSYAPFELRNLVKITDTTESVCHRYVSEDAQQNLLKLCSYEGHTMLMCITKEILSQFFSRN